MLIGLTGRARSGKDTVGAYLSEGYGFDRVAFAHPIKAGIRAMFGLTHEYTDGDKKEVELPGLGKSPRELMQTLGTEWGRELVKPSVWVDLALWRWTQCRARGQSLVITDVRFENEAEAIRAAGGSVWHLRRTVAPEVRAHSSETGVEFRAGIDREIVNDGELDDLFGWVDVLLDGGLGDAE